MGLIRNIKGTDWIHQDQDQDRDKYQVLVKKVINDSV
jgi:hypothetical protein